MLLAAAALLMGCVDTFPKLYSQIPQYQGQNIDALVDRIGYAESQTFTAGGVVYTWTTASRTVERPRPPLPIEIVLPHYVETGGEPETVSLRLPCTLKVATDGRGTILHILWEGKPGACAP